MDTRIEGRNGIPMLNLLATILTVAALLIAAHNYYLLRTVSVVNQNFGFLPEWTRGFAAVLGCSLGGVFVWYVSAKFATKNTMCDAYITAGVVLSIVTLFGTLFVMAFTYLTST